MSVENSFGMISIDSFAVSSDKWITLFVVGCSPSGLIVAVFDGWEVLDVCTTVGVAVFDGWEVLDVCRCGCV